MTDPVRSRLRERREALGIGQERLARLADCSLNTIGRLERGEARPKVDVASRIARALGCRVEDLWPLEEGVRA